jgi:hypothetical protein
MTNRNFRVNNGLEVGDIVISASANTITGGATGAPSGDGDFANKKYVDDQDANIASDTLTFTNKTFDANGTGNSLSNIDFADFASGVVADEDNMSSNSATKLATQQSIKAYVDSEISGISTTALSVGNTSATVADGGSNGSFTVVCEGNTEMTVTDDGVRVHGNLTVDGTQTIINTSTLSVEDNIIEVNRNVSANSGMPSISGLKINRGDASSATENDLFWAWDETFADDGTTTHGNAGGAFTAFRSQNADIDSLVDIRANVVHAESTSAQYADVAERFEADALMTPGAVVMVGGEAEITETTSDLSDQVFGVISEKPAYAMNAGAGNNESHPFVAMTGRTPVRVTGTVNKGDRLVTSSIKGCARAAATGESITPFNVIGRALESSTDAGIKLVNCAVRTNN